MDDKIAIMNIELKTLETLESQTDKKKLWVYEYVHDSVKSTYEVIFKMSERIEASEFLLGTAHGKILQLNKAISRTTCRTSSHNQ